MSEKRKYSSKEEIYEDYDIALKFRTEYDLWKDSYDDLRLYLGRQRNWKVERFSREVRLLRKQHDGKAIGIFVDVPVENSSGDTVGARSILLGHESGPEWFLSFDPEIVLDALTVANFAGKKIVDQLVEPMVASIKESTHKALIESGNLEIPISYVEIRTKSKGVMRILYDDFDPPQLSCLVKNLDSISHISEVNHSCFKGHLFDSDPEYDDDGI